MFFGLQFELKQIAILVHNVTRILIWTLKSSMVICFCAQNTTIIWIEPNAISVINMYIYEENSAHNLEEFGCHLFFRP